MPRFTRNITVWRAKLRPGAVYTLLTYEKISIHAEVLKVELKQWSSQQPRAHLRVEIWPVFNGLEQRTDVRKQLYGLWKVHNSSKETCLYQFIRKHLAVCAWHSILYLSGHAHLADLSNNRQIYDFSVHIFANLRCLRTISYTFLFTEKSWEKETQVSYPVPGGALSTK